jgi:segregation and condensation protein A
VELWDLVSAFGRLLRETMAQQPQEVVVNQTPLHVHMAAVVDRLGREGPLPLSALFTPPFNRGRLVGLFLAVLELTKARRVVPEQAEPFGDIWLALADAPAGGGAPEEPPAPGPHPGEAP